MKKLFVLVSLLATQMAFAGSFKCIPVEAAQSAEFKLKVLLFNSSFRDGVERIKKINIGLTHESGFGAMLTYTFKALAMDVSPESQETSKPIYTGSYEFEDLFNFARKANFIVNVRDFSKAARFPATLIMTDQYGMITVDKVICAE